MGKLSVLATEMSAFLTSTGLDVSKADPQLIQAAIAVGQFCVGRIKTLVVEGSILETASALSVSVTPAPLEAMGAGTDGGRAAALQA